MNREWLKAVRVALEVTGRLVGPPVLGALIGQKLGGPTWAAITGIAGFVLGFWSVMARNSKV